MSHKSYIPVPSKYEHDKCFQCGHNVIITSIYQETINNSLVTTTKTRCSDAACQKRTELMIKREKAKRDEVMNTHGRTFASRGIKLGPKTN